MPSSHSIQQKKNSSLYSTWDMHVYETSSSFPHDSFLQVQQWQQRQCLVVDICYLSSIFSLSETQDFYSAATCCSKKFKKKIYVHNFQCLIACTEDTTRWYSSYLLVMWGKGILRDLSFVASFKLLVSDTFLMSRQEFLLFSCLVWLNASHWKKFKLLVCCGNFLFLKSKQVA